MREGNRVWIDGVGAYEWGCGKRPNTFIGSLWAAMNTLGHTVSYEELMGVSGAAFRVQFFRPAGCPSSAATPCGFDCSITAVGALPYELTRTWLNRDDPTQLDSLKGRFRESIDRGLPVFLHSAECGLGTGYTADGDTFLIRNWCARGPEYTVMSDWPWEVGFFSPKTAVPERRSLVVGSLEIVQQIAHADSFGGYASGFTAYREWIGHLRSAEYFAGLDQQGASGAALANAYNYDCLKDARRSAGVYLRGIAGELPIGAATHINAAAALYERIATEIMAESPGDVAPYPWMLKDGRVWTQAMRDHQANVLEQVMRAEEDAASELGNALAALR